LKIFIFIPWFYPAYKAGGPIQSITNLILALQDKYSFSVITSAYDLQSKHLLPNINPDKWNSIHLPGSTPAIPVWYSTSAGQNYKAFKQLIIIEKPDIVYLNSIYSIWFTILPLIIIKNAGIRTTPIICPRGMLQRGNVTSKYIKKKVFINLLNLSGLLSQCVWHATNAEEKNDILTHMKRTGEIIIASNIPKKPLLEIPLSNKIPGRLRLIYLSLISSKKNLYFLLELLQKIPENVSLDIYGPVKDKGYWKECIKLIAQMRGKVKYMGDILPSEVQHTFCKYEASILLTKGENFGHALYESLSVGRPIITSYFTPWNNLENQKAGWNVDITDILNCESAFKKLDEMTQHEYDAFCSGAFKMAKSYYYSMDFANTYAKLFN